MTVTLSGDGGPGDAAPRRQVHGNHRVGEQHGLWTGSCHDAAGGHNVAFHGPHANGSDVVLCQNDAVDASLHACVYTGPQ